MGRRGRFHSNRTRQDYRIGQRVRLTDLAISRGVTLLARANRMGTVVGVRSRDDHWITVRPDGYRTKVTYHVDFWEPVTEQPDE
jgi:hypothetical protein